MGANLGFQKHNIEKELEKKGINDFDLEAELDSTLSMKENKDKLEKQLGISLRDTDPRSKKGGRERQVGADKKQAQRRHEQRPRTDQRVDESIEAETVFDLPLKDGEFERWADNPGEFDVEGVDTR